jgi:hypothetical protein
MTQAWGRPRPWQGHENLDKWTNRGVSVSEICGHFWADHLKQEQWKIGLSPCKWLLHSDDLTVTPWQELSPQLKQCLIHSGKINWFSPNYSLLQ